MQLNFPFPGNIKGFNCRLSHNSCVVPACLAIRLVIWLFSHIYVKAVLIVERPVGFINTFNPLLFRGYKAIGILVVRVCHLTVKNVLPVVFFMEFVYGIY